MNGDLWTDVNLIPSSTGAGQGSGQVHLWTGNSMTWASEYRGPMRPASDLATRVKKAGTMHESSFERRLDRLHACVQPE